MAEHSKFSASAAERWLACPGSISLSEGKPDRTSVHAARGTVAHTLLEDYLVNKVEPESRLDEVFEVDGHTIIVDQGLIDNVRWAIGHIAEITTGYDIVQAESRTNYSVWLNVPTEDGFGTADVTGVHVAQRELLVADYKNGHKPVNAVENPQMMLYAGGKLTEFEDIVDIETVRMVILQPEAGAPKEWTIPVVELKEWLNGRARSGAASVLQAERFDDGPVEEFVDTFLNAGDHCQWCKAKATCPKLRGVVAETVFDSAPATPEEFEPMTPQPSEKFIAGRDSEWLAATMGKLDLIESWVDAIRAEVTRRLAAGETVPGYKLVQGKRGARAWADAKDAEEQLKAMRLKVEEMYDLKLISPTSAEKLTKGEKPVIGPRQWKKLQERITQPDGKPHVAPETDPRPAITVQPVAEMFDSQAGEMV